MFNIGENTKVLGLEKTHCKLSHIQQCLYDKNAHEIPIYDYLGKFVQRGTIVLHTCKGDHKLKFKVNSGWAEIIEFID